MATIQELIGFLEQMKGTKLVTILMPIPRVAPPEQVDIYPSESWYLQSVMIDRDVLLDALKPVSADVIFERYWASHDENMRVKLMREWITFKQSINEPLPDVSPLPESESKNDAQD